MVRNGFTLVEMLVAVAVLSILFALSGVALSRMIDAQQVRNAAYDIYSSLAIARSEALTRNTSVTVAPLEGGWSSGWTLTESGGRVLRRQSAYARVTLNGPARVIFNGDGRPDTTATPFELTSADVPASGYRCVRLRLNGRSAIAKGPCS